MTTTRNIELVSFPGGEDLNADLNLALTVNATGQVVKTTEATDVIVGTLAMDPGKTTVAGDEVSVAAVTKGGITKMIAGGAITGGHLIVPDAAAGNNGKVLGVDGLANLAAGQTAVGIALDAATAEDEVIRVLIQPMTSTT